MFFELGGEVFGIAEIYHRLNLRYPEVPFPAQQFPPLVQAHQLDGCIQGNRPAFKCPAKLPGGALQRRSNR